MAIQRRWHGVGPDSPQHAEAERLDARDRDAWRQRAAETLTEQRLARALGWFSLGLGLAEVIAPRGVARLIGVKDRRVLLRVLGLREIASGVGILTRRRPAGWLWARVAGDVMDLGLLLPALVSNSGRRGRVAAAATSVIGVSALDVRCARNLGRADGDGAIRVRKAVVVDRSPQELYRFWRDFENLPRFMTHLQSVQVTGERRSHWAAKAPAGTTVEWDAELVDDRPNELLAWRSLEGAAVEHAGSVQFTSAPEGRGTLVTVELRYTPPGGIVGSAVAKLFGEEPGQQVQEDLRHFKQVMEAGERPTTSGQPSGRVRVAIAGR